MTPTVHILDINSGSDGDGRKWPKHHYVRNDEYFKERIATDKWIHDLPGGPEPNVIYRLDKLPNGYAGFERARPDSKHVDRYIYGHPNGQFRSLNEFYPHFKHLMDYGGSAGCTCKQCLGIGRGNGSKKKPAGGADKMKGKTLPEQSKYFASSGQATDPEIPQPTNLISPYVAKSTGWIDKDGRLHSDSPERPKRKRFDYEGTPDVYEILLNQLKESGDDNIMDVQIEEHMSPDWRACDAVATDLFAKWSELPRYVPRIGEVALFVRNLNDNARIAWDQSNQTFRCVSRDTAEWLEQPKWEAGVVTQMPLEPVRDQDILTDNGKEQGVNYSGFRMEPLSAPGRAPKVYTKQYKHVPLHALRPCVYWRECMNGLPETEWHPSIQHALSMSSSLCVVGRYRFRGTWPNATIFARGVYIGSELVVLGDVVRLLPRSSEQPDDTVTDIMIVTAIRLRFINLDAEDDDTAPDHVLPHQTSLHISGRVYTLDPARSFDGIGKVSIDSESDILPAGLKRYAPWFHYTDPAKPTARIEVPYTRILGRCFEDRALDSWFSPQSDVKHTVTIKAASKMPANEELGAITKGLAGVIESRQRARKTDERIKCHGGKTWFWADTRAEQLDLHEVNGRHISTTDEKRTTEEMLKWRTALKALDGKKGALEEYRAARKADAMQDAAGASTSAYGMVAASRQIEPETTSAQDSESIEEEDAMDVDDAVEVEQHSSKVVEEDVTTEPKTAVRKEVKTFTLSDSEDEEDAATNRLASELAKSIRPNDARLG